MVVYAMLLLGDGCLRTRIDAMRRMIVTAEDRLMQAVACRRSAQPPSRHCQTLGVLGRWSINFFAMNGSDILQPMPPESDELTISVTIPRQKDHHTAAVGAAVVVHFGYSPQQDLYYQ